jgi:hypothetical protein
MSAALLRRCRLGVLVVLADGVHVVGVLGVAVLAAAVVLLAGVVVLLHDATAFR